VVLDYAGVERRERRRAPSLFGSACCGLVWGAFFGLVGSLIFCRLVPTWAIWRLPGWVYLGAVAGAIVQVGRFGAGRAFAGFRRACLGFAAFVLMLIYVLGSDTRLRAELEHGIGLPWSASNIQCRGDALTSFGDRAAVTWFEMNHSDLAGFLRRLEVTSRGGLWATWGGKSTPRRRVWAPHRAALSNPEYSGHAKTWAGEATPNQAMQCRSPVGDFLVVEILDKPDGGHVVKMWTDWN
jgi:hypothetical protein